MRSFGNSIAEAFDKVMSKTQSTQTTDNDTSDSASAKTILPRNSPPTHRVPQNSISHKIMVKCPRCNTDISWELLGTHLLKCPIKDHYPIVQAQKPRVVVKKPEAPHKSKQVPQKPVNSFVRKIMEQPEILTAIASELSGILEYFDIPFEDAFLRLPDEKQNTLRYAIAYKLWKPNLLSMKAQELLINQRREEVRRELATAQSLSNQQKAVVPKKGTPTQSKPQHSGVHQNDWDDSLKGSLAKGQKCCRVCGSSTVMPGEDKCYSCQSE